MKYVADTHSLVWYFTKDKRLSARVREIIKSCERGENILITPSICLLEALDIAEKKKIDFDLSQFFYRLGISIN